LVKTGVISKQDNENAQSGAGQAEADVAAGEAALRAAQIDLARTTIRAPITGHIGRSIYTTGALVTASQTERLATIQRLDPIYVDIQESSTALYGSWPVPISVMLVVPLGVVGALLAATLTGENNDIYLQVGLVTTIGVSAKNAILIVKFAEDCMGAGMNAFDAAIEAAKLRLRPILMTNLAFVIGVFPLAISTGAGAGGQNAIGRAVVGGMLSGTILAIFLVPMFFIVVRRLFGRHGKRKHGGALGTVEDDEGGTAPQGV
jgi:AcrB/AcrD/AcrF family